MRETEALGMKARLPEYMLSVEGRLDDNSGVVLRWCRAHEDGRQRRRPESEGWEKRQVEVERKGTDRRWLHFLRLTALLRFAVA